MLATLLIWSRDINSGAVVVTNPRLPLARLGGYDTRIFGRAATVARLSTSLPRGVREGMEV